MRIRNKKIPIIIYTILLVIFIPLTIFSVYLHFTGYGSNTKKDQNVDKLFKFDGKLYFYDEGILVGTYTCKTSECDYANETIDDNSYALEYYDDKSIDKVEGLFNNRYAFISDAGKIILYDALKGEELDEYTSIKNYTIGLNNNRIIVNHDNNEWGVIELNGDLPNRLISYQYKYLGVQNTLSDNNKLNSDLFVAYDGISWKIINTNNIIISSDYEESIFRYNNSSVITTANNNYHIYDYNGNPLLPDNYKYINYLGNYLILVNTSNIVLTYDSNTETYQERSYIFNLNTIEIKNDKDVYYDGQLKFSI